MKREMDYPWQAFRWSVYPSGNTIHSICLTQYMGPRQELKLQNGCLAKLYQFMLKSLFYSSTYRKTSFENENPEAGIWCGRLRPCLGWLYLRSECLCSSLSSISDSSLLLTCTLHGSRGAGRASAAGSLPPHGLFQPSLPGLSCHERLESQQVDERLLSRSFCHFGFFFSWLK